MEPITWTLYSESSEFKQGLFVYSQSNPDHEDLRAIRTWQSYFEYVCGWPSWIKRS